MPPNLEKARETIEELRGRPANIHQRELVHLAESLGRFRLKKSTKHPMYGSPLPGRRPLSIPGHSKVKKHTAKDILNVLEADIEAWEQHSRGPERGAPWPRP